jgi:hypothetical protein
MNREKASIGRFVIGTESAEIVLKLTDHGEFADFP